MLIKKKTKVFDNIITVIINVIVTLIFLFLFYHLWDRDFRTPIAYNGGDGIGGILTIKKAIDGKGFNTYDFFCAPYGVDLYSQDYFLPYFLVNFVVVFTKDVGIASNLFWILTYIATAISMTIFLKRLGCSKISVIFGSLLYNFLPYHYFRLEHFWLMGCYIIPILGYVVLEIIDKESENQNNYSNISMYIKIVVLSLLIGLNGLYYAVFSIMIICISLFYVYFYKKKLGAFKYSLISIISISIPIVLFYIIPLINNASNELSNIASDRNIAQINSYGLNLVLLFLPIPGHRISLFSKFTEYCYEQMNINSESFTESLGLIISIGLIVSVIYAFKSNCKEQYEARIKDFGVIIILIFLIATIGGINNFIAIFFSSSIRCYNRLSIYIALFSVGTICMLLDVIYKKINTNKYNKVIFLIGVVFISFIGVADMTSDSFCKYETYDIFTRKYVYSYDEIGKEYRNDKKFFDSIYNDLDEEKMLYIAPYKANHSNEKCFDRLKISVSNTGIKTSNCEYDEVFKGLLAEIDGMDIEHQLNAITIMGYSGILIDKNSFFSDKEVKEYIESISKYIDNESLIESQNNNLLYYSIKEYKSKYMRSYSQKEIENIRKIIYEQAYNNSNINAVFDEQLFGVNAGILRKGESQYGPYTNLKAGRYQVVLVGDDVSNISVDVSTDIGKIHIPIENVEYNDFYIKYEFTLDEESENVEFLSTSEENVKIYGYYYTNKDSVDLGEFVENEKELYSILGIGIYKYTLPINSFKINEYGEILNDEITIHKRGIQYGPYIKFETGEYVVSIEGENLNSEDFHITSDCGKNIIETNIIENSSKRLVYLFYINEDTEAVEFVYNNNNSDDVCIRNYQYEYIKTPMRKYLYYNK